MCRRALIGHDDLMSFVGEQHQKSDRAWESDVIDNYSITDHRWLIYL